MAINKNPSSLDPNQTLQHAYDDDNKGFRMLSTGGSLVPEEYDRIEYNSPDTVTDVWTYKSGGASGTTVATVTIVFTDASKETISSVQRS